MSGSGDYPNSGLIFRDGAKRAGDDRSRDYRGEADITCPHCSRRFTVWLSGWIKQGRKGKFLGLKFTAKERPLKNG